MPIDANDYVTRVFDAPQQINAAAWNRLLAASPTPTPFMRHEYLLALHHSASACAETGWAARFMTLWRHGELAAACPLYLKTHSYGEYVFDWAWAQAYEQHGLAYYPKALIAVPFTPVPGSRLLAHDARARTHLLQAVRLWVREQELPSLHLLFGDAADYDCTQAVAMQMRRSVQFHWHNAGYRDFEDFLTALNQDKRKKIRQERRKVAQAGVQFRCSRGSEISAKDWAFFYQCYQRTYWEHGNAPYLSQAFFQQIAATQAQHWLMFIGERDGQAIAASLIALGFDGADAGLETSAQPETEQGAKLDAELDAKLSVGDHPAVAYGRYWGALERVDCLHFEACYYQPIEWCIKHQVGRFEGGAQGEHKMARALLPTATSSAHELAHPGFAQAVQRFLARENTAVSEYLSNLGERSPLRHGDGSPTS